MNSRGGDIETDLVRCCVNKSFVSNSVSKSQSSVREKKTIQKQKQNNKKHTFNCSLNYYWKCYQQIEQFCIIIIIIVSCFSLNHEYFTDIKKIGLIVGVILLLQPAVMVMLNFGRRKKKKESSLSNILEVILVIVNTHVVVCTCMW